MAVTLRYLATGDSYSTLQYAFTVASSTIIKFVLEVCDAIIIAYRDQVMRCPTLPEDWLQVESILRWRWNILPAWMAWMESIFQSDVHNGEAAFHSIVLLALVDGDFKFLWVEVGAARSSSDAQFFKHSNLRHKIEAVGSTSLRVNP